MKINVLSLLVAVPFFFSCTNQLPTNDEQGSGTPEDKPVTEDAKITISSGQELSFTFEGGTGEISFTSDQDWTVAPVDDWVTLTPNSGKASTDPVKVTVTASANKQSSSRDTYLVITAGKTKETTHVSQTGDPYADAAPEIKSGDVVLAPNKWPQKFIDEISYPDHDYTQTFVMNYYGGFNGQTYDAEGNPDPNGEKVTKPVTDMPSKYSIRWEPNASAGELTLLLKEDTGWTYSKTIKAGSGFVNITNLLPQAQYTYSVTSAGGDVLTQGNFSTTGTLHQIFFETQIRNARDLGGWKTYDGKTVKYRKIYRGGRLEKSYLTTDGKADLLNEGIKAQLDLRGDSDVLSKPAVDGLAFCAPHIETGGDTMLKTYKEKTRECVQFTIDCIKEDKPVYFHCSLGRDRTGTFGMLILGILDVIEGDISKEYELTYFSPRGYSIALSETSSTFQNVRTKWAYQPAAQYIWENFAKKSDGSYDKFSVGVEKYFLSIGISQEDIDTFRSLMLE